MLRKVSLFFFSVLLILSGQSCQKRYWYRVKVLQSSPKLIEKKDTISVEVINYTPYYLSLNYEKTMKAACEKQLRKIGFVVIQEDVSSYHLLLQVRVDSFNTSGISYMAGKAWSYERKNVKAILFSYLVRNSSNGNNLYWEAENDIYFFDIEKRDTRRSRGIVKYTLRHIP